MQKQISGLEQLARDFFKETMPNERVVYNERFTWLLIYNPNFDKRTERELDIYFPDLRVGVEVNGGTHRHSFIRRVDKRKHVLCKRNGVTLYDIWSAADFWRVRYQLYRIYGTKVAPEISKALMDRMDAYFSKKMNKYEQQYLIREIDKKNRLERQRHAFATKTKEPARHRQHLRAKQKALSKTNHKFLRREERLYAEAE